MICLVDRYESNTFDDDGEVGGEFGNESEEYAFNTKKTDELDRYLALDLDKSKLNSNPLCFWSEHKEKYPRLSRLARSILSIPATSASVDRKFFGAGHVIDAFTGKDCIFFEDFFIKQNSLDQSGSISFVNKHHEKQKNNLTHI